MLKDFLQDKDMIYTVGHLVWPLQIYGNKPNREQENNNELFNESSTGSNIAINITTLVHKLSMKLK